MATTATPIADCTVPEKILLAAHHLEEEGQSPFSAEALIVTAWQKYPRTFGLKGFAEQFPDSNKVLASIMGEKGLARRGWLAKMGQKLYALTREGRQVVRRLVQSGEHPVVAPARPAAPVKVSRDHDRFLLHLFASTALQKYLENRKGELTFADACRYWTISENMTADALDARLKEIGDTLTAIERAVGFGSATLSNGRSISAEDTNRLSALHEHLEDRFARHLNLLRNRAVRT